MESSNQFGKSPKTHILIKKLPRFDSSSAAQCINQIGKTV